MDVFLVPVGPQGHELYCEVADLPEVGGATHTGVFRSLVQRFRETLAAAERERRARLSGTQVAEPKGLWGRIKARTLRWAAEAIAEQRLLWHLRGCANATLAHPDDMPEAEARAALRSHLAHDYDKHRGWFIIDLLGFAASGVLMLVPGPNLLAYYFAFRVVGHYLSMRGARHGLDRTEWRLEARAELREVREIVATDGADRDDRLREIETRLRLEHFAAFVARVVYSAR
jgi:hypothetical protein